MERDRERGMRGDGGNRGGNNNTEGRREEDESWYGRAERRFDLGDRRGSGSLGTSEIGVFRPDYRVVTPYRWARRRERRLHRYYDPYYYGYGGYGGGYWSPPNPYYYGPRVYRSPRSWWNFFW